MLRLRRYFLSVTPLLAEEHQEVESLRASLPKYQTTMVMQRPTDRPDYPPPPPRRVPSAAGGGDARRAEGAPPPAAGAQRDRLALARWLVSDDNPLVGRVVMNRVWSHYFGQGIVKTVEDFGVNGERPTHPELLDWLATEFPRQGWSMKAMHRLIVTSATYRQSARRHAGAAAARPAERVARPRPAGAGGGRDGARHRPEREPACSTGRVGGPSVYPPQPEGVAEQSWGAMKWPTSTGPDRWRRGLYTFLKRTAPYPGLTTFDAPTSEVTCPRRARSNTPLQALTVLNDSVFVEAAQAMAGRVVTTGPKDAAGKARFALRLCVTREPEPAEVDQVVAFYESQLKRFRDKSADAKRVATSEAVKPAAGADLDELAAWTVVSRALLNLDETITK